MKILALTLAGLRFTIVFFFFFLNLNKNCLCLAWLVEVGLQGTTATDISCPAVEAATEGIGMTNIHFYGLDTWLKKKKKKGIWAFQKMIQSWTWQLWFMTLPRLSNIFWMVVSLASTMTRLASNIRTFIDNHLEDIHRGWSTLPKKSSQYNCGLLAMGW